jgi:TonB family protein
LAKPDVVVVLSDGIGSGAHFRETLKGCGARRCSSLQPPLTMKTSPMLIIGIGVLLTGSVLAQTQPTSSGWQSMKILQTVDPVFPSHLLQIGAVNGEVRVVINTDADGSLADWLVIGYTNPEFADAAIRAVKQWKFEPGRLEGTPVGTTVELDFHFEAKGVVVSTCGPSDLIEARIMRMMDGRYVYQPCKPWKLDRTPAPLVTIAPRYPGEIAKQGVKGVVTIDFFIDETGAVRLPAGVKTEDNMLTALALDAMKQWKFTPPTSRGKGVLVKARQEFDFNVVRVMPSTG